MKCKQTLTRSTLKNLTEHYAKYICLTQPNGGSKAQQGSFQVSNLSMIDGRSAFNTIHGGNANKQRNDLALKLKKPNFYSIT